MAPAPPQPSVTCAPIYKNVGQHWRNLTLKEVSEKVGRLSWKGRRYLDNGTDSQRVKDRPSDCLGSDIASYRGGPGSIPGHVGLVVDKVALGQGFSECFGFPCQFLFHWTLNTRPSSRAGTVGELVADVPSGLSLTSPHKIKKKRISGKN
jgi:hypothetical protein